MIHPDVPLDDRWRMFAACRGASLDSFFLSRDDNGDTSYAKEYCVRCPVRIQCLDYACFVGERYGVWGGAAPRVRDKRRRFWRRNRRDMLEDLIPVLEDLVP